MRRRHLQLVEPHEALARAILAVPEPLLGAELDPDVLLLSARCGDAQYDAGRMFLDACGCRERAAHLEGCVGLARWTVAVNALRLLVEADAWGRGGIGDSGVGDGEGEHPALQGARAE